MKYFLGSSDHFVGIYWWDWNSLEWTYFGKQCLTSSNFLLLRLLLAQSGLELKFHKICIYGLRDSSTRIFGPCCVWCPLSMPWSWGQCTWKIGPGFPRRKGSSFSIFLHSPHPLANEWQPYWFPLSRSPYSSRISCVLAGELGCTNTSCASPPQSSTVG